MCALLWAVRIAATGTGGWEDTFLLVGRVMTLNMIQSKEAWTMAGGAILLILLAQLLLISKAVLQKRRHLRALEDVKKM